MRNISVRSSGLLQEYINEVGTLDKYEYKIRAEEIKALIAKGEFVEAVGIADTIDWRRVKSVMMLCTVSDLYKINRRYQESKDILLLAYERNPTGRLIIYSLCELSIKMGEFVQAVEYYKEFVQIAPKDTGRYILQYRLYEAQDVSLEERIAVLEEFKKRDYREKWAYELAYLYHRIGLSTKCVEECDELFLWFGEGRYVVKALELKALHVPLNEDQQAKYDAWTGEHDGVEDPVSDEQDDDGADMDGMSEDARMSDDGWDAETEEEEEEIQEAPGVLAAPTMELPEVKPVDVGQYNTINLQMALAESMKEILDDHALQEEAKLAPEKEGMPGEWEEPALEENFPEEEYPEEEDSSSEEEMSVEEEFPIEEEMPEAEALPVEEEKLLAGEKMSVEEEFPKPEAPEASKEERQASIAEALIAPLLQETAELPVSERVEEKLQASQIIEFPDKAEEAGNQAHKTGKAVMNTDGLQEISAKIVKEDTASLDAKQILEQMKQETQKAVAASGGEQVPGARTGVLTPLNAKPSKYDHILSQEYDGQISLVMPDAEQVEKQITGQLSIDDIMAEWEEMKKSNEQKRMEEVKQRIMAHTGNLFADFDEATKNGLLEELERAFVAAIMKDSARKPAVKKVVMPDENTAQEQISELTESEIDEHIVTAIEDLEEKLHGEEAGDGPAKKEKPAAGKAPGKKKADKTQEVTEESVQPESQGVSAGEQSQDRELTEEEEELFGQFAHHRKSKRQLVYTLDNMSLASCTGNVVITGEEDAAALTLAKALVKEMQYTDSNFSGKVAKISANVLNQKDVAETFARLDNGALIIEKASRLKPSTVDKITKALEKDNRGLFILIVDKKQDMNRLLAQNAALGNNFNLRVDIEPLDNEALVAYAKQYAEEMEYSIDEFGILALHTRIADRQTSDHEVSMSEVRDLVDEAIDYANKKTPKHFMDILLAKRYDEEDMIILRERDFMHY